MKNKYGLSRSIDESTKKEIRQRSKYGCVVCRSGIIDYEHINLEWIDAKEHNPDNICCLCPSCHAKVTRGFLSKKTVKEYYENIQIKKDVKPPSDFFDFHGNETKLYIGNIIYESMPETVLEYCGEQIISIKPGNRIERASINAKFTDSFGVECFNISGNEWIGKNENFDLEVTGARFIIKKSNRTYLKLKNEPPGKIIVEQLDMRYKDIHILASDQDLAIGRYNGYGNNLIWLHLKIRIDKLLNSPKVIIIENINALNDEYTQGISATKPKIITNQVGSEEFALLTDQKLALNYKLSQTGVYWPALGIQIAKGCDIAISGLLAGVASLEHARKNFFKKNRMNVPQSYLPSILNKDSINKEFKNFESCTNNNYKPPFLYIKDKNAIKQWRIRKDRINKSQIINTAFLDDEPGCYLAFGPIRLNDNYNGPAIKVSKIDSSGLIVNPYSLVHK